VVVAVEVVAEATPLLAMSVAWVAEAVVASVAVGEVLLRAAMAAVEVVTAALPLVATPLLLAEPTAAVVAMVEATATHLAPAATRGGRSITPSARLRHPNAFSKSPGRRDTHLDGLISLQFTFFTAFSHRLLRNETDSGISYPNQHIDSDCFADLPIFELSCTGYPFDDTVELGHRLQDPRLLREGTHYERFTHPLLG